MNNRKRTQKNDNLRIESLRIIDEDNVTSFLSDQTCIEFQRKEDCWAMKLIKK